MVGVRSVGILFGQIIKYCGQNQIWQWPLWPYNRWAVNQNHGSIQAKTSVTASQVKRDRACVAAHKRQQSAAPRVQTRSMAAVCLPTELELHAGDQDSPASDIEQVRYDDTDKSERFLDPLAVSCEASQVIHTNSILSRGYPVFRCADNV